MNDNAQVMPGSRDERQRKVFVERLLGELPALRTQALRLEHASNPAHDLLHDTVERGLARWHRFRPGSNLRGWLFVIMQNLLRDRWRERHRKTFSQSGLETIAGPEDFSEGEENSAWKELGAADVQGAAERLPRALRDTFELVAFRRLTYRQAAEHLGVGVSTIGTRAFRARARIRLLLLERLDHQSFMGGRP